MFERPVVFCTKCLAICNVFTVEDELPFKLFVCPNNTWYNFGHMKKLFATVGDNAETIVIGEVFYT